MTAPGVAPTPDSTRLPSVPARPVALADGQSWGFAVPTPRYRPEVVAGIDPLGRPAETVRLIARIGYPWPLEQQVEELHAACEADGSADGDGRRFDALMTLAVALLRRAHDLATEEAVGLLDLDGDGLIRLVDAVLAAVAGCSAGPSTGSNRHLPGGGRAFSP